MSRYPHALVACASAMESALKAGFSIDQHKTQRFSTLLSRALEKFPPDAGFLEDDIAEFRKKRNEIIHYGFSPKDDAISAILLLKTGYALIGQCYKVFFHFPLEQYGEIHGGLLPSISRQLDIARKVYLKAKTEVGLNFTYCFIAFAHEMRWGIQHWMISDWQREILSSEEEKGWAPWKFQLKQKEELAMKAFDLSWDFDCPICENPESFVCELDEGELEKAVIRLKRGVCVSCSLIIPENCPFLADELCSDQLSEAKPRIIKEFGIA